MFELRNEQGFLHCENGPAIEWHNGAKEWYRHGKLHREDGPAIEWFDGTKIWYHNGKFHREDGPAIIWPSGKVEWWLNGESLSFVSFLDTIDDPYKKTLLVLQFNDVSSAGMLYEKT